MSKLWDGEIKIAIFPKQRMPQQHVDMNHQYN
jgi:hypothetical protein